MTNTTNLIALKNLAREIANNWETCDLLEQQTTENFMAWIRELALQGQRLIHVKTQQTRHGDWMPWCEAHCPVPYWKINRCMVIAANFTRVENSSGVESMRQVLALCRHAPPEESDPSAPPPRRWAPAIEANLKLSKLCGYVERFPITTWPTESQDAAREKLLPMAAALWPAKFA